MPKEIIIKTTLPPMEERRVNLPTAEDIKSIVEASDDDFQRTAMEVAEKVAGHLKEEMKSCSREIWNYGKTFNIPDYSFLNRIGDSVSRETITAAMQIVSLTLRDGGLVADSHTGADNSWSIRISRK